MENTAYLDSEELLHLALKATKDSKTEDSIEYLKRAIDQKPNFGKAYYLLGALHAELGLYDRAIKEITRATELEPSLDAAHFQLGLLYITSGNLEKAEETWQVLDHLADNHPFRLFKNGMLLLATDQYEKCIETLEEAIKFNTINEALNNDMRRVIEKAKAALSKQGSEPVKGVDSVDDTDRHDKKSNPRKHVLLSAYQSNEDVDETTH